MAKGCSQYGEGLLPTVSPFMFKSFSNIVVSNKFKKSRSRIRPDFHCSAFAKCEHIQLIQVICVMSAEERTYHTVRHQNLSDICDLFSWVLPAEKRGSEIWEGK